MLPLLKLPFVLIVRWNAQVRGQVFFAKFAARRAMLLGAQLATTFGDSQLAATYTVSRHAA